METIKKIFRNPETVKFKVIRGGKTREVYFVNKDRTPQVFKMQPNPGWHRLVENREIAISQRRKLITHYQDSFNGDNGAKLLESKFNIVEKNGESIVITVEKPRFDIYPGAENGYIDLCSPDFGTVNGSSLQAIIEKNFYFKKDLKKFLENLKSNTKYQIAPVKDKQTGEVKNEGRKVKLILDFYGLSNLLYKDGQFIINNSAFKFDYDGIPISTWSVRQILRDLHKNKQSITEDQKYILKVAYVSMGWINDICKFCDIEGVYKIETINEIDEHARHFDK